MHQTMLFIFCEAPRHGIPASRGEIATERFGQVNEQELKKRLEGLRSEHRDLDTAIAALIDAGSEKGYVDQLQIARLKKRKLRIRDQIAIIEDTLLPDIIA